MSTQDIALRPQAELQNVDALGVLGVIARAANDPTVDVTKMQALLEMQKDLMRMQAEREFNAALVDLQAEVPRVSKLGQIVNKGTVQSTFARYEDIDKSVRPLMRKYGFAVSFDNPKTAGGLMEFTAELRHRAGHKKDYHLSLPVDSSGAKNSTQGAGSTFSYAKRYLLCDILNIVTEGEDNDGNGPDPVITADQRMDIETVIHDKNINLQAFLTWLKVPTLADIPAARFREVWMALEKRK